MRRMSPRFQKIFIAVILLALFVGAGSATVESSDSKQQVLPPCHLEGVALLSIGAVCAACLLCLAVARASKKRVADGEFEKQNSVAVVVGRPPIPTTPISRAEVAKHNTKGDCWIVVHNLVLNVTEYMPLHPGGEKTISIYAGQDATQCYDSEHYPDTIELYAPEVIIGQVSD